jgi:hypothetical protein
LGVAKALARVVLADPKGWASSRSGHVNISIVSVPGQLVRGSFDPRKITKSPSRSYKQTLIHATRWSKETAFKEALSEATRLVAVPHMLTRKRCRDALQRFSRILAPSTTSLSGCVAIIPS